jgi:hypothetical protein
VPAQSPEAAIYIGNWDNLFGTSTRGPGVPIAIKVRNTGKGGLNLNKLSTQSTNNNYYTYFTRTDTPNTSPGYSIATALNNGNAISTGITTLPNTAIFTDGNVVANQFQSLGNSAANASDIRLKENIEEIKLENALSLVQDVKPITFTWKRPEEDMNINGTIGTGVIAQELLKNGFEHLVSFRQNPLIPEHTDDEGYTSTEGYEMSVNYVGMIPYHTQIIRYLLDEIKGLKEEIKNLKEK